MMVRQIIIPTERTFILEIPESFIGKRVEVLAFEVEDKELKKAEDTTKRSIEDLFSKFDGLNFDSQGTYTFNRDEATDYE